MANIKEASEKAQPVPEFLGSIDPVYGLTCLVENIGSAVFIASNGKLQYINAIFQELCGCSWEKICGRAAASFIYKDDKKVFKTRYAELSEEKNVIDSFECRVVNKNGALLWVLMHLASARCQDDKVIIGSFFDISYRKEIEAKLETSAKWFKLLFEYAPDAYYLSDTKGVFIDGNIAAEKMIGYSKKELIGKNYLHLNLLAPEQIVTAAKLLARNALGRPTGPDEFFLNRKDGSKVIVGIHTFPIRIAGKYQVLAIARDISNLKKTEDMLHKQAVTLSKRLQQLNCLYEIATIKSSPERQLDETLQYIVDLIPSAWQYPELTCARITLDGKEFKTARFRITPLRQAAAITIAGEQAGTIEVYFLGDETDITGELFSEEEKVLLTTIARDVDSIIQRKRAEERIQEMEKKFEAISMSARDAIILLDDQSNIIYWNKAAEILFGYETSNVIGEKIFTIIAPANHCEPYQQEFKKFKSSGQAAVMGITLDLECKRKNGTVFPSSLSLSAINLKDRWNAIAIIRDITERKQMEDKLVYLANNDQLTGLPNRALFHDRLTVALSRAKRYRKELAVMVMDMDNFKAVNDTKGHDAGDRLLKAVADRMKAVLRTSDTLARMGGDEFCMVAELAGKQEEKLVAKRILEIFAEPFELYDCMLTVTMSIGVAVFPRDGSDITTLIKNADAAMYRAKDSGRNNFFLYTG
jgi:diguanylate cyclase (GGDEF)-like protein/PAS domain S-box-containing protein